MAFLTFLIWNFNALIVFFLKNAFQSLFFVLYLNEQVFLNICVLNKDFFFLFPYKQCPKFFQMFISFKNLYRIREEKN